LDKPVSPAADSVAAGAGQQATATRDVADAENAADTSDSHALTRQAQASLLASLPEVKQALLQWLPVRSDAN